MNSKAIKRQLLAAIAMVLVAAIALGSSTYAWFVASGTVKAEGMKVHVQAESGILIKEVGSNNPFGTIATVTDDAVALYPTSTTDMAKWYHATSTVVNDAKAKQDAGNYKELTVGELPQYRFTKQFAIRSATSAAVTDSKLLIQNVTVDGGEQTQYINKSIRVGIKVSAGGATNSPVFIYAPKADDTFTLVATYANSTTVAEPVQASTTDFLLLDNNTIPATDTGLVVDVFIWYEGEDGNCMTENVLNKTGTILTPDTLSVSVEFTQAAI